MEKLQLTQFAALAILFGIMVISELVAKSTGGKVPGAFTISVLLLAGYWTILPTDLMETAGLTPTLFSMVVSMLVTHLGTLIGRQQMISQWKTVVISLMGIVAICMVTLTLGAAVFGWTNAVAGTPTITGGVVATTIMANRATELGNATAALVAIVCMTMQGLVGYPLAAFFLGKEAKCLKAEYQAGRLTTEGSTSKDEVKMRFGFTSAAFILFKLALLGFFASTLQQLTGGAVNQYVWCLLLGFAAHKAGILETDALNKANSYGFCITILLIYLFGQLSTSTPETILSVAGISLALVLMATAGMTAIAFVASKLWKGWTWPLASISRLRFR